MSRPRTYTVTGHDLRPLRRLGHRGGPGASAASSDVEVVLETGAVTVDQRRAGRRRSRQSRRRRGRIPARMNTAAKVAPSLAAFGVALGVAFAVGAGRGGRGVGPIDAETGAPRTTAGTTPARHRTRTAARRAPERDIPGGLMVSQNGYTLALADAAGRARTRRRRSRSRSTGPDGHPVTDVRRRAREALHLIAVRRDFTGFQHVHPTLEPGRRVVHRRSTSPPGQWRVFADFKADRQPTR